MKKRFLGLVATIAVLTLAACSAAPATSSATPAPSASVPSQTAASGASVPEFPKKNMTVIVPFSPGGAVDVTQRLIAETVPSYFGGKQMIVENVAGGGAIIGQTKATQAAPDGYTLLATTTSYITNILMNQTPYNKESIEPIAMYSFEGIALVVPSNSPYKDLNDFFNAAKEKEMVLCTSGHSTTYHIAGMLMEQLTGVKFKYVHNDGAPTQIAQLLGGHADCATMAYGEVLGQLKDGSLRILGTMSKERKADDIPTFTESGYELVYGPWRGFSVPKGTPAEVIDALDKGLEKVLNDESLKKKMEEAGYPISYGNREYFQKYYENEFANYETLVPMLNSK